MSLMEAALELASSGVPVFPCGPDKAPRVAGGFKSASTDEAVIRSWSWDGALIGAAVTPGIIVVDTDPRNGGDGTVDLLKKTGKTLPATRLVRTRSGGTHRVYTVPPDLELRKELGPGVDVQRAGKAYVIAPPSEGYELRVDIAPVPAPDWLLEELKVEPRDTRSSESAAPKFWELFEHGTAYGLAAMERELGRLATQHEGGRNHALNKAAFSLSQLVAGGELHEDNAKDELLRVALLIGLEVDESRATIDSGWRAGEQEPRQAPERALDQERTTPSTLAVDVDTDAEAEGRFWVDWDIDEPEPPFFLHPILPKNAYVIVYGATEAAKSMTLVGLLCQASLHGIRSSIYSLENPPHTDRNRLRRWGPDRTNLRLTNQPLDLNDVRQVESLIRRERDWGDGQGTDVLLIDTYSHAFNSRSEDGNAKAIEFARRVRFIMAQVGCSVIVVDHTGFEGDEPRDASAKRQQVDVAVLMEKSGEWKAGQPARTTMRNRKSARFANPFRYSLEIRDTKDGALELAWMGASPAWETDRATTTP